jgi:beta-lactamase class D
MNKYIFYFLLGLSPESTGQKSDTVDLRSFFGDFAGGFCVYDLNTDHYIRHNPEHCNKQFSACSTFKIPNSLIGLETGVIADTAFMIPHDSMRHPKDPERIEDDLIQKNENYICYCRQPYPLHLMPAFR